jgi:hypothetical protein
VLKIIDKKTAYAIVLLEFLRKRNMNLNFFGAYFLREELVYG